MPAKAGISRALQWRAKQIANIPEEDFEAIIESDNPPTVTALVEYGRGSDSNTPSTQGLRQLQRAWNRASNQDRTEFLKWISGA